MVVIYIVIALIFCLVVASWFFTQHIDNKIEKNFLPPGQFSNVQQEKIHYTKQGQGPVLILIHGLAGNALNFTALANQLAKHYTVYSIDRPGSGFSTRHRNTSADFNVQSATILAWMSQLNLSEVFVAGHSMGGAIALRMALDAPDRIKSVSLLCPLTVPLTKGPGPLSMLYIPSKELRSVISRTLATPLRIIFGKKQVAQIFFPERVPANFGSESGGALTLHSESFYQASCDMVASTESLYKQFEHYKTISCPVGILYGEQDVILSPDTHMSHIATSLPSSMAEIIPNAGHMIINTQPEACFDFINKVNKIDAKLGLA